MSEKPLYIREIEENTGLRCERDPKTRRDYLVLSPTGVKLFRVGGHEEGVIGMVSTPEMYEIQGITTEEKQKRWGLS